jgi:hypothetical protein
LGTVYYYVEVTGAEGRLEVSGAAAVTVINPDSLRIENAKTAEGGSYGIGEPFKYRVYAISGGDSYNISGQVSGGDFSYNFSSVGTKGVSIAPGSPLYGIPLSSPVTVDVKSLEDRAAWADTEGGSHTLLLYADENMPGVSAGNITNAAITLESSDGSAGGMRTLSLNSDGSMFYISGSGAKLVLGRNLTLAGKNSNNASLVHVISSGELVMEEGSVITGNICTLPAAYGGGVYGNNGTFTMNGGTISGNKAGYGGGVFAGGIGSRFTMNSPALIRDNEAASKGGGVYISDGLFTMNDGAISGNEASGGGGGVYVSTGIFTMNGGIIGGDTAADKNTGQYGGGVSLSSVTGINFTMAGSASVRGNKALWNGGGVYVSLYSVFIMKDLTSVSGNESVQSAGGVYVTGTFTLTNGTVHGNDEPDLSLRNTAGSLGNAVVASSAGICNGFTLANVSGSNKYEDNTITR